MPDFSSDFFDFSPTIYLNCAFHGPFPRVTVDRIREAIELKCNPVRMDPPCFFDGVERVRARLAKMVGADPSEIALTNSATQGIGLVATGLRWKAGDEVVVASCNFPSNLFTWIHLRRLGVKVHVVKPVNGCLRVEDLTAALTPRTRVLALDWVSYTTGARIDLASLGELAHQHGSIFLVDGTQGVGAIELNLHATPVDVIAVAGYKWLLGPYSTGFVYLNRGVQELLELESINWLTVDGSQEFEALPIEQFTLPKSAKVFDVPDTANFLNLYALEASLEFIERVGVRTISQHCSRLLDRLAEGAIRQGFTLSAAAAPERRSTILCFQADSLPATQKVFEKLTAHHIAVSLRQGMIRVSPYLYNADSDIERLLEAAK